LSHLSAQVVDKDMVVYYRQLANLLRGRIGEGLRGGRGESLHYDEWGAAEGGGPHPFEMPAALARLLSKKVHFRRELELAYQAKDRLALAQLVGWRQDNHTVRQHLHPHKHHSEDSSSTASHPGEAEEEENAGGALGDVIAALDALQRAHARLWHAYYRPFGWEVLHGRYGALRARLEGVGDRVESLLLGQVEELEELELAMEMSAQRVYNTDVYKLPLMCWARATTPAMPSIKGPLCSL